MHRATRRFWKCVENLPEPIRKIATQNFSRLKANPRHPSLHFKKVGKFWSARVGLEYRALAVEDGDGFIWIWIGSHNEYERLVREVG